MKGAYHDGILFQPVRKTELRRLRQGVRHPAPLKLRDGRFLCDDCGNKCSKYIRLSELTLDEAKEHMEYMARMKRVFDEVFDKTEFGSTHTPPPRRKWGWCSAMSLECCTSTIAPADGARCRS